MCSYYNFTSLLIMVAARPRFSAIEDRYILQEC